MRRRVLWPVGEMGPVRAVTCRSGSLFSPSPCELEHVPRKACSLGLSLWFFVLVICRYMCLIRWIRQGKVINAEQRASLDDAIQPHYKGMPKTASCPGAIAVSILVCGVCQASLADQPADSPFLRSECGRDHVSMFRKCCSVYA